MKLQQRFILFFSLVLLILTGFGFRYHLRHDDRKTDTGKSFVMVELFTSEGCSSCPAAEALTTIINNENNKDVHILAFHVDYWNQYGWKDIFSSNAYTVRQEEYAGFFKLKSIYTPQAVVNGKTEFVGSDERKLRSVIKQELNFASPVSIDLEASVADIRSVNVTCSVNDASNSILNLALVQKFAQSDVRRGENAGKILKHIDVVRGFKKISVVDNKPATARLFIPEGVLAKDCKVVAYVQDKDNFKVTAVMEKSL